MVQVGEDKIRVVDTIAATIVTIVDPADETIGWTSKANLN